MCYLELENISKTYESGNEPVTAVSEVSLSVERGEFIAITGPSGCGKSTLLHIIGGLNRLSEGNVYVEGRFFTGKKQRGWLYIEGEEWESCTSFTTLCRS